MILIDNIKIFNYFNLNMRFLFKSKSIYLINIIKNKEANIIERNLLVIIISI